MLVHGFTQTGRSWESVAAAMSARHEVIAVDLPGHGRSSAVHASVDAGVVRLASTGRHATYVGYSLGGRHCLRLGLSFPDLVERLVLISTSPGIEDASERAARRETDAALAESLDPVSRRRAATDPPGNVAEPPDDRARLRSFLRSWLAQPMFSNLDHALAQFENRLAENTCAGLASSLRLAGAGVTEPVWDRLGELRMPVLAIAGERDHKYARIAARMVDKIGPNARLALIDGAGHAPHLERPETVTALVLEFVERTAKAIPRPRHAPTAGAPSRAPRSARQ